MAWDDLTGVDVHLSSSPVETTRFGVSVGRLSVGWDLPTTGAEYQAAADALADALERTDDDVVVVRYPAHLMRLGAVVSRSGRDVVPAGTLTYWGADADGIRATAADLEVVPAGHLRESAVDVGRVVDDVIADAFAGYGNHYLANPLLDGAAALAGYQDWARRSLVGTDDALVLLARGKPIGVATMVASRDGRSHLEVLLAGLVSVAQGRGSYAVLLAACAGEARRRELERLIISTQVHNVRVQRAWARLGLRPFAAIETLHAVRAGLLSGIDKAGVRYGSAGHA